ncbi:MAG: hypothetical protein HYV07_29075 [Deltaproteobacteria bacterium]|nr:hypothetical protein [Deltaproteobacteria bacterium]
MLSSPLLLVAIGLFAALIVLSILKKVVKLALIGVVVLLVGGAVAAVTKNPEAATEARVDAALPAKEKQARPPPPKPVGGFADSVKYNERTIDFVKDKARKAEAVMEEHMDEAADSE